MPAHEDLFEAAKHLATAEVFLRQTGHAATVELADEVAVLIEKLIKHREQFTGGLR